MGCKHDLVSPFHAYSGHTLERIDILDGKDRYGVFKAQ